MSYSEEEKKLIASLRELGLKPKADTKEDLQQWLEEYSASAFGSVTATVPETKITVNSQTPRISIFYGDVDTLTKGEVVYDQWKYEVLSLLRTRLHKEDVLLQAIRRSLKGEALKVLTRLRTDTSIREILDKLDSVYGVVDTKESILARFYAARQGETEDIATWSCRLEDLLAKAVEKELVQPREVNDMLKGMLWTGMRSDLKSIFGYKVDQIDDFDRLRVELRKLETEHGSTKKNISTVSKGVVPQVESELKKEVGELKKVISTMSENMTLINEQLKTFTAQQQVVRNNGSRGRGNNRNRGRHRGGYKGNNSTKDQQQEASSATQSSDQQQKEKPKGDITCYTCGQKGHFKWQCKQNDEVECYRCRQKGHFQWQCNLRDDYLNQ